jgi:thiamine biosynthesis lipoprotein
MGASSQASTGFPALGGLAVVAVTDVARLDAAVAIVARTVDAFDVACSSFRDDSELTAVNAAGGRPVTVSPLFLDAVEEALRAARLTDGDVDPTVGEALVAFGFFGDGGGTGTDAGRRPGSRPRLSLARVPGYTTVRIDRDASTVTVARGVRLDLGATAKALAADRAAAAAADAAGCGVLVSLSGDISIAGPGPADGWRVRVTDDHRADVEAPGQWITLQNGGLATSSTTVRRHGDRADAPHHVIDPATGRPAREHFRTVSVAAATCLDANIASTASIVRGPRAIAWLQDNHLPSRLVLVDGSVDHIAGWPSEGEDLAAA